MPNAATRPLFERGRPHGMGMSFGYAELTPDGPSLQHLDPGRPERRHRRQVPQGAPARPCRIRPAAHAPASREALLRAGRPRLPGLAHHGRHLRHVHLQRPALARDLSGDGPAGRRDGRARLQYALGQLAKERGGAAEAHLPPQALAAGRRLSELDLGGGRGQGRRRGRPSACSAAASSSTPTARSSPRRRPRTTSSSCTPAISTPPASARRRSSTSSAIAASSTMDDHVAGRRGAAAGGLMPDLRL